MAEIEHRAFSTLIAGLEHGSLHEELTRQVTRIVEELHDMRINQGGKPKAMLAIKLNFKLDGEAIEVAAETKTTMPKRIRDKTILYATEDNNLTTKNPRQGDLPLRDVSHKMPNEFRTA